MPSYEEETTRLFRMMQKVRPRMTEHMTIARRGEALVLRALASGERTPGELAELSGTTPGRISAILSALERKNMIVRKVDERNRRRVLVSLTDYGRNKIAEHKSKVDERLTWVFDHMGRKHADEFLDLLTEFMAYFTMTTPCGESSCSMPDEDDVQRLFDQRYRELSDDDSIYKSPAQPQSQPQPQSPSTPESNPKSNPESISKSHTPRKAQS